MHLIIIDICTYVQAYNINVCKLSMLKQLTPTMETSRISMLLPILFLPAPSECPYLLYLTYVPNVSNEMSDKKIVHK